jgi:hypothetical protein
MHTKMPRTMTKGWLRLGTIRPTELGTVRLELHAALQIPAALGIARATPAPDFAQHALTWDPAHHALVSALVPGRRPYRAGLRLAEPTLLLLNAKDSLVEALPLAGRTFAEGLAWLGEASERYTGDAAAPLARPAHELPDHALYRGERFGADPAHTLELAHWFGNLSRALGSVVAGRKASPVRVWSHHFDLDTVLDLGDERTLGLGFSPGDEGVPEPYLYALPTPYPEAKALPPLAPPFEWITDGWIGAVLHGSALATVALERQAAEVERFYRTAEEALLGLPDATES